MSELTSSNWSETAASNNASPPNGWPEGMNPSDVNNSAREDHAAIKRWFNRTSGAYTAGGGTTNYTLTPTVSYAAYADELWSWIMPSTNAADATMNISGLGARNIQKLTTAGYANVIAGDMPSGAMVLARYSTSASKFYILSMLSGADLSQAVLLASLKSFVPPGHRLSLTTAVAVTTADVTGAGTIYWTPKDCNIAPVYNGSVWILMALAELSFGLDSNSGHTGYHQSGKNFDAFLDYNAGTPRIVTGPAWSSDTGRAAAISRDATYGFLVNSGSMTAKFDTSSSTTTIAAGAGLYLGTFRCTADAQTEDSLAKRFLWNMYNRAPRSMRVLEATNSWTYSTNSFQQANASTANQIAFVRGLNEDAASADVLGIASNSGASPRQIVVGVGLDSASAITGRAGIVTVSNSGNAAVTANYNGFPGLGYHYLAWLEYGAGADTQTWLGDNGAAVVQTGITGTVFA